MSGANGWHWPLRSIRRHYFENGHSLCGYHELTTVMRGDEDDDNEKNCRACYRWRKGYGRRTVHRWDASDNAKRAQRQRTDA